MPRDSDKLEARFRDYTLSEQSNDAHTAAGVYKRPRRLWSLSAAQVPDSARAEVRATTRTAAELSWLLVVLVLGYVALGRGQLSAEAITTIMSAALAYSAVILAIQTLPAIPVRSHWPMIGRCLAMIALITWVLWCSGEHRGLLVYMYHLVVITCALALGRTVTLVILLIIVLCVLTVGEPGAPLGKPLADRVLTLFLQIAPMMLVGYVTARLASDIRRAVERIRFVSETDELTRLYNLRAFMAIAERNHRQSKRYGRPYALVMIDSDNLKSVNDNHGHDCGNELLKLTTLGIRRELRETDVAGRYGGDEFILLLPETTAQGGRELAERIRRAVADKPLEFRGIKVSTTISIGIAAFPANGGELRSVLNKADQAMYLSKKTGRNRVTSLEQGD
jgi:diguanylate cyclase (GGDEF)-like protein